MNDFMDALVESLRALGLQAECTHYNLRVNGSWIMCRVRVRVCVINYKRFTRTQVAEAALEVLRVVTQKAEERKKQDQLEVHQEQIKRLVPRPKLKVTATPEGVAMTFTHTEVDAIAIAMDILEEHGLLQ